MTQALYRKYRPRKFGEVVGQSAITETLTKAIKSGRISHAYLFSGPRGVGKTSVARILAHEINRLPYSDETIHLDIIEIDAASNRRIDEIRDLRDKVHIAPTSAKYKVYIIDEVHMLTKEAFNALLKTLEEPPAHCVFILATTEPHKLPETIISRTQRFSFKPVAPVDAVSHMAEVAKREKIDIERDALTLLAEFGEGSFRDSLSLLDQVSTIKGKVTADKLQATLGLPPATLVTEIKKAISAGNLSLLLKLLDETKQNGVNASRLAQQLSRALREELIEADKEQVLWLTKTLKELADVPSAKQPSERLEINLIEAAVTSRAYEPTAGDTHMPEAIPVEAPAKESIVSKQLPKLKKPSSDFSLADWPKILAKVRDQAGSLYSALRLAQPVYEDGTLTLVFSFDFHKNKAKRAENLKLLSDIIGQLNSVSPRIECVVDKSRADKLEKITESSAEPSDDYQTISNIFGSAEMLES